jgi:hypothetical protein
MNLQHCSHASSEKGAKRNSPTGFIIQHGGQLSTTIFAALTNTTLPVPGIRINPRLDLDASASIFCAE